MTSYEISKHLQSLLDATGADRSLTKYLFVLAKGYERISGEFVEVLQAKSRSFFSMKQQDSQDRFNELRRQSETFPLGQIFHDVIELQSLLKTLATAFEAGETHFLREMGRHLASFHEVFEKLMRNPSREAFAALLPEASHLYTVVVTSRQFFSGMRQALQLQGSARAGHGRLSLIFETTSGYDAVVRKLMALQTGYREICRLSGVSAEDHPLEIVKLEASSLFVCVDGVRLPMQVLASLVESFALFWYHRFSSEDRHAAPNDRVSATHTLVSLADEMERAGVLKVSPDAAEIRDAALAMRRVLLDLLEGEPTILVNDKAYAVDPSQRKLYIEVSEQVRSDAGAGASVRMPSLREITTPVPMPGASVVAATTPVRAAVA